MAGNSSKSRERLAKIDQALTNTLGNPVILEAVGEFGYTPQKMQGLKARYDEVAALFKGQVDQTGSQISATAAKDAARDAADAVYLRLFKVANVVIKDPGDRVKLVLNGNRNRSYKGWRDQVDMFYTHSLGNPGILSRLAEVNITVEKLEAGRALFEAAEAARDAQTNQIGNKQQATVERDLALDELEDAVSDYLKIAEVALEDKPQLMESLGSLVRSSPAARAAAQPAEPAAQA